VLLYKISVIEYIHMQPNYATQVEALLDIVFQNGASDLHLSVGRHPFIRVQGNAYIQSGKVTMALRTIEKIRTLSDLKLPQALVQFTRAKQGFFLVVGPVGQGKSTTLAAMIDAINTERREHILTIEHPIEYMHVEKQSIIDQREVGLDTQSFHAALESVFREDANVVLVGEMQNPDTIATAVTAAETGHLIFSTLHTNSAAQTIDRIIDSFPPAQQEQVRMQLSSTLLGVFSQRLIPSLKGGRVVAYELLINTKGVATMIREGRTHEIDTAIETGSEHGMISMNRSLIDLVQRGEISIDDARTYTTNPDGLAGLIQ
jgi:twitching motility protein PilT